MMMGFVLHRRVGSGPAAIRLGGGCCGGWVDFRRLAIALRRFSFVDSSVVSVGMFGSLTTSLVGRGIVVLGSAFFFPSVAFSVVIGV